MYIRVFISAVLFFLSFPPFNLWFFIFPALFFFYYALLISDAPFVTGFLFGSISFGVILFGIQSIGYEAWTPLVILMGLLYAFLGKIFKFIAIKTSNNFFVLIGVLSIFDLLRAYFPFGGFPWGSTSTVLLTGYRDSLFNLLPSLFKTFGPTGYSLIIQSVTLIFVLLILDNQKKYFYLKDSLIFFTFLFIPLSIYLANSNLNLFLNNSINEKVSVSIVQGNSPCPGAKNNCNDERKRIYESHLNLTRSIQNDKDLIIWPESSTGFRNDPLIHERVLNDISYESQRLNSYFLIGGDRPIEDKYFENYGVFINNNGLIVDQYLKQHPVPFGEYIPFRDYLDWIPSLSLVPRDMIRGDKEKIFQLGSYKLSTVISFEGSFQRYIRNSIQEGAEIIVILTNQASYGQSGMSEQFLLMSRANAISNDRPIIHSAITGKSAFIDNDGNILSDTNLFTAEILNQSIQPIDSQTPYSLFGNYFNLFVIGFGFLVFLRRKYKFSL